MTRRTFWMIILALGALARLALIWQAGMWYDENFTLLLSRLPFMRMLAATVGDVHPPLHYLIVWPLGQIPNLPPWALRLPSALISIAGLALYPRLMRGLRVPSGVRLIAFCFLAFLPMQIHYAQEARMYALLEFLVIAGAIAIIEGRAVLLTASVAGLLYTQNYGTFYVAVLAVSLLMWSLREWWMHRSDSMAAHFAGLERDLIHVYEVQGEYLRRLWFRMAAALLIGVVLWVPWLPIMLQQMESISGNYWIFDTSPGGMLYEIFKLFWAISLGHPAGNIAGLLLTFALLILSVWYLLTLRPHSWLIIACLAFGPILMAIAVSLMLQPILLFRPLIGVTPFLYLACAYPLGMLTTLRGRLFAACFVLPLVIMSVGGYYAFNPEQKLMSGTGNMQAAVDFISLNWQPGDVILDGSDLGWVNLRPYTDLPQYSNPNCTADFPGAVSPASHDALGIESRTIDELPPHERVWFVAVISPLLPACELARTNAIIGDREPALVMEDTDFLLSAIWLLEAD